MGFRHDAWERHFRATGHSCGQVGDWYYCNDCGWESGPRPPHEHDASCAFGNPQCPEFAREEPPTRFERWITRMTEYLKARSGRADG